MKGVALMKIKEVSAKSGVSADTLRYYEKIGLVDPVQRNANGIREYRPEDLGRIEFIKCMRSSGLSIETLRLYISLYHIGETTIEERKNILIDQRAKIQEKVNELQETIGKLDGKIENYEERILVAEKRLLQ